MNKKKIITTNWGNKEEHIGDFIFRPPVKDGHVDDELIFDAGKYFIHIERMHTQGIWIGISDSSDAHKAMHLNFYIGDEQVKDEDGNLVYPLLLRVDNEELDT